MSKPKIKIIAEIGVNHDGSLAKAIKLVRLAKKIGADVVKFQAFDANKLCKVDAPKTFHQKLNIPKKITQFEMLKKLELKPADFLKIFKLCKKLNIEFLCTPYDLGSVDLLEKLGVKSYKVSSQDLVDFQLHERIIKTGKTVILSTGASSFLEIEKTINFYKRKKHEKIILMHCLSNYPCSLSNLNLSLIKKLDKKFKYTVGFSDHSNSMDAAKIAIAFGASIVEKHFTLNKKDSGPDHSSSFDPNDFKEYIKGIRQAEKMIGFPEKKIHKEEISFRKFARKSITLNKNLKKNHILTISDLSMKRPGTALNGQYFFSILGKKLNKDHKKNYQIKLIDIY